MPVFVQTKSFAPCLHAQHPKDIGQSTSTTAFWSSVMLSSARYHGKPVQMHAKHLDVLTPGMFTRWLELWTQITHELFAPEQAAVFVHKATQIATSLKFALFEFNAAH